MIVLSPIETTSSSTHSSTLAIFRSPPASIIPRACRPRAPALEAGALATDVVGATPLLAGSLQPTCSRCCAGSSTRGCPLEAIEAAGIGSSTS